MVHTNFNILAKEITTAIIKVRCFCLDIFLAADLFRFMIWNKLDPGFRNSESLSIFRKKIFSSSDQLPILFITVIILKGLNLLRYFDLG